jgi:hypothetical protein
VLKVIKVVFHTLLHGGPGNGTYVGEIFKGIEKICHGTGINGQQVKHKTLRKAEQ